MTNTDVNYNTHVHEYAEECLNRWPTQYFGAIGLYPRNYRFALQCAAERGYIMKHGRRPAWGRDLEDYTVDILNIYTFTAK